jgi:hypothetical protein
MSLPPDDELTLEMINFMRILHGKRPLLRGEFNSLYSSLDKQKLAALKENGASWAVLAESMMKDKSPTNKNNTNFASRKSNDFGTHRNPRRSLPPLNELEGANGNQFSLSSSSQSNISTARSTTFRRRLKKGPVKVYSKALKRDIRLPVLNMEDLHHYDEDLADFKGIREPPSSRFGRHFGQSVSLTHFVAEAHKEMTAILMFHAVVRNMNPHFLRQLSHETLLILPMALKKREKALITTKERWDARRKL